MARDKESLLQSLNGYKRQILTTKELEGLNVSKHFKNKFVEEGVLKKIARGKYQVVGIKSTEEQKKYLKYTFDMFYKNIISRNYVAAYKNLIEINKEQVTTKYDEHHYMYFSLLRELIGEIYDFSMLEKMNPSFSTNNGSGAIFCYESFSHAVLEKNYEDAYKQIDILYNIEKNVLKKIKTSTQLFRQMTKEICEMKKRNIKSSTANLIINDIKHKNYQWALARIENKEINDIEMTSEEKSFLIFLLKKLEFMKETKQEEFIKERKSFQYCGTIFKMLISAINFGDFYTALDKVKNPKYKLRGDTWVIVREALESLLTNKEKQRKSNLSVKNEHEHEIDTQLKACIKFKTILSTKDLIFIKQLLFKKLGQQESRENTEDIINFIDFILEAQYYDITEKSFISLSSNFSFSLHNGDYITVSNKIQSESKNEFSKYSALEIDLIKCLLNTLKDTMAKKKYKPSSALDLAFEYRSFYQLIEEEKWEEAMRYYFEHSMKLSEEGQKEILGNLVYLWNEQKKENKRVGR